MPKLRRRLQTDAGCGVALPFDMPKLRKRQMDSCARVISLDFEIGGARSDVRHAVDGSKSERLEDLPFDMPKLKKIIDSNIGGEKKPERSTLFLDVIPNSCCAAVNESRLLMKTFQNKSKCTI